MACFCLLCMLKLHILDPLKEVVKVILSDRENVNDL
jgi:hypothetical protein